VALLLVLVFGGRAELVVPHFLLHDRHHLQRPGQLSVRNLSEADRQETPCISLNAFPFQGQEP
jgi:hypothetical protein